MSIFNILILANPDGSDKFGDAKVLENGLDISKCLMYDPSSQILKSEECIDGKGICKSNLGSVTFTIH